MRQKVSVQSGRAKVGGNELIAKKPDLAPGTTVLMTFVPAVDALRCKAERLAGLQPAPVAAHITLLFPFVPASQFDHETSGELMARAADHLPIEITFRRTGRFPQVLWLDPESEDMNALVSDIRSRWPDHPPYGDPEFKVIPHLTLAQLDDRGALDQIEASIQPQLPVTATADSLSVLTWDGERWRVLKEIPTASRSERYDACVERNSSRGGVKRR